MPPPTTFNASSLNSSDVTFNNLTDASNITEVDVEFSQPIASAPIYLFCCALSLAAVSAFLRAGFVLKFIAMICCIAIQGCVLSLSQLYAFYDHETEGIRFDLLIMLVFFHQFPFFHCFFMQNAKKKKRTKKKSLNLFFVLLFIIVVVVILVWQRQAFSFLC